MTIDIAAYGTGVGLVLVGWAAGFAVRLVLSAIGYDR